MQKNLDGADIVADLLLTSDQHPFTYFVRCLHMSLEFYVASVGLTEIGRRASWRTRGCFFSISRFQEEKKI